MIQFLKYKLNRSVNFNDLKDVMGKEDRILNISINSIIKPLSVLSIIGLSVWATNASLNEGSVTKQNAHSYIISAKNNSADYELLKQKVSDLNLTPTHTLAIIDAIAVELTDTQLLLLKNEISINVSENYKV